MQRKGIILAGGSGTRLFPLTIAVSKQLMPVYDKPMIYYPLSVLMLCDIREILLISTPNDLPNFKKLLKDGSHLGFKLSYAQQPEPKGIAQSLIIAEKFLNKAPSCLILGDNLFYGAEFIEPLKIADKRKEGATIFGYLTAHPEEYGVVEFQQDGKAISLEEKPQKPKSHYAIPGLYFYDKFAPIYAKKLKPSQRGELEITDLNQTYLNKNLLNVEVLGRGMAWLDTGNCDSLAEATDFVRVIQKRQGLKIACIEEIAYQKKWLSKKDMQIQIKNLGKTSYAAYLEQIL